MTTITRRALAGAGLLVTAVAALLAGCGQRGDLYLPTPQKSAVPAANAPCTEPASTDAKTTGPRCSKD